MKHAAVTLSICLATLGVQAQTVYRCGSEYTQSPCAQGRLVDAVDARSAAQRAQGERVAAIERRLGTDMERDRLAAQAALKPAGASSLGALPQPAKRAADAKPPSKRKRATPRFIGTPVADSAAPGKKRRSRS